MKKLLKIAAALLALGVGGVLVAASGQPDTYHVERSLTVAAAPADVFPYMNDYNKWPAWNPWQHIDPNQKMEISDPAFGVGAWNTWEGNSEVGKGKMSLVESVENEKTVHEMHFIEPFEDTGTVTFSLAAEGEQTRVTWAMDGGMNMMSKVMCMFMGGMDTMLAPQFDKGLATLKPLVEADAAARVEAERVAAEAAAQAAAAAAAPVEGAVQ